jgi:hypothetical protein
VENKDFFAAGGFCGVDVAGENGAMAERWCLDFTKACAVKLRKRKFDGRHFFGTAEAVP